MKNNIFGGKFLPISAGEDNPLTDALYLRNGVSQTGYYPNVATSPSGNLALRSGNNVVSISRADGDTSKQIILMPGTEWGVAGKALLGYNGSPWADGTFNDLHVGGNSMLPTQFGITFKSGVESWGNPFCYRIGNIAIVNASFHVTGSNVSTPFTVAKKPIVSASIVLTRAANAGNGGSWIGTINQNSGDCITTNSVALTAGYYKGLAIYITND